MVMTHIFMQKFKVKGQFVEKIELKQTDGRTDTTDRIFPLTRSVTSV